MVTGTDAPNPMEAFAIVGVAGVGAQWLAWRFRMPAIVLMLVAGLILGPVTGIFVPERDIGALLHPMISLAVAVYLFDGGLTLYFRQLGDARPEVMRLVLLEARGRVLSRQQIEERLYSWDAAVESNAVEVHIHHLRRKLGSAAIQTMRGVGYFMPQEKAA